MSGRVILFGATGFTGRITAEAMTRAGLAPVLAARHEDALIALVGDLAGLAPIDRAPTWQQADVSDPASVRALVTSADDVLVSTVGPFHRLGRPALDAALDAGCGYVDSTGEAPFIRTVFEEGAGSPARLLTAFGYDFVPGNLAAALAIRDASHEASGPVSVEVGYFTAGPTSMSSGTKATMAELASTPGYRLVNGAITRTRGEVLTFDVAGKEQDALAIGTSEAFALPRLDARIRDVTVALGWFGKATRAMAAASAARDVVAKVPGVDALSAKVLGAAGGSATGEGPSREERADTRTIAVARTKDGVGRVLSQAQVEGPSPYDLTGELLAWAAAMLLTHQETGTGPLGPADAFGLDALVEGCADMGLVRTA